MRHEAGVRRVLWGAVVFLAVIGSAVAIRRMVAVAPVVVHGYYTPTVPANSRAAQFAALDDLFARYPILTLIHIVPGLVFMVLGPLQFSASIRARNLRWHRWSGRIFVICGTIIGVSALVMSFGMPAIGGVTQAAATTLFGGFFLFALSRAFWHIRRREVAAHREWMIRAFSIGLAVATIRPIIGLFFATSRFSGLTPREFFGVAFWIGFTLHLITAEAWIHATSGGRRRSVSHWRAMRAEDGSTQRNTERSEGKCLEVVRCRRAESESSCLPPRCERTRENRAKERSGSLRSG